MQNLMLIILVMIEAGYRNSFGYSAPASHRLNRTKTLKDHSIAFRIALY